MGGAFVDLRPLSVPARVALGAGAFVGSAVHSISFVPVGGSERLVPLATGLMVASGVSWFVLGFVILALTRLEARRVWAWFDTCLIAQNAGIAILMGGVVVNLVAWASGSSADASWFLPAHVGFVLLADLVMATVFTTRAARFGTPLGISLALWVGVLNGACAALIWLLGPWLGYR